jgi:seryl-tRNA(Sec) selenium transferase
LSDAAAEEDLKNIMRTGADLIIYSGAKAIEAPVMVIGRDCIFLGFNFKIKALDVP